jgi:hypothetical protein
MALSQTIKQGLDQDLVLPVDEVPPGAAIQGGFLGAGEGFGGTEGEDNLAVPADFHQQVGARKCEAQQAVRFQRQAMGSLK